MPSLFDELNKELKTQRSKKAQAEKKINELKRNGYSKSDDEMRAARNRVLNHEKIISDLKQKIDEERDRVGQAMERNLGDLNWLNNVLEKCGLPTETTAAKARASIKKNIIINIYDLEREDFGARFPTFGAFLNDIHSRKRYFPLKKAKSNGHLKLFLKVVFGRGGRN